MFKHELFLFIFLLPALGWQYAEGHAPDPKPTYVAVVPGDKYLEYESGGFAFLPQYFGFDPEKRVAGAASGGPTLTLGGVPVPVIAGFRYGRGGSMSAVYANTILDFSKLELKALPLGKLYSTKGEELADVRISLVSQKKVFISSDYAAFPEKERAVPEKGPFATVVFDYATVGAPIFSLHERLVIKRNGKEIWNSTTAESVRESKSALFQLDLEKVKSKDDVLAWSIQDAEGTLTHTGEFGFPVTSAVPRLMLYQVKFRRVSSK
jgi:hypothetical protein